MVGELALGVLSRHVFLFQNFGLYTEYSVATLTKRRGSGTKGRGIHLDCGNRLPPTLRPPTPPPSALSQYPPSDLGAPPCASAAPRLTWAPLPAPLRLLYLISAPLLAPLRPLFCSRRLSLRLCGPSFVLGAPPCACAAPCLTSAPPCASIAPRLTSAPLPAPLRLLV